jgi:hypothetical protein
VAAQPQKIDITKTYPCPCCRQGQLLPITLTEALGCNRCQQIFSTTPDHLYIEQLAVSYAYRKAWFWQGRHWVQARELGHSGLPLIGYAFLGFVGFVLLLVCLFLFLTQVLNVAWQTVLLATVGIFSIVVVLCFLSLVFLCGN